jgi:hypothetical protein
MFWLSFCFFISKEGGNVGTESMKDIGLIFKMKGVDDYYESPND